ncbi:MAG TPA: DUF5916 domain-containing protein [Ferruginibacter sp.]|nr:DUF5916 domain-containing protein [Ferruginibacter sp.]
MKCFKPKALCFCILLTATAFSQAPQRKLTATRSNSAIKIDGLLDDAAWKTAPVANEFFEWRPNADAKEEHDSRSEIYILYDNTSVYVAGYLHEKTGDSISTELAGRDKIGSNDFVGVIFDTYNDKINGSGFYVTPLGEQYDAKYSNTSGEDDTWNAVWYSESKLQKDGWTFEMRIPYSALRFSSKGKEWGLNITRKRVKSGKQYMWNPVVPTINGFINQEGLWTGISDIKPPVRLSLSPYFSTYLNYYPKPGANEKKLTQTINGGMDIKYGINQNYTLDMTLIPDFGQVQSDRTVLNLTPFEVKYNENRAFFTEGTELFNKGNLFYSRRIGGRPLNSYKVKGQLNANEYIDENPLETKLLNATKISGRNQKGLGIGFFNAITQPMHAIVKDDKDNSRKIETNPLTNYNIIVFDQTLKNNSSVSLINTSVLRSGKDYDANVTAAVFDVYNKKNVYNVYGKIATSRLSGNDTYTNGYAHNLGFGKTGGRFNFNLNQDLTDEKYNINDMGILYNNNQLSHYLWIGYKWVKPGKWYNNMYLNFNNNLGHRFKDGAYQSYNFNVNINGQLKNLWYAGLFVNRVFEGNDFYESRVPGRVFRTSSAVGINAWGNTNQAKKYYAEFSYFVSFKKLFDGRTSEYNLFQRYRFNDKFSLSYGLYFNPARNNAGFADIDAGNNVVFSRRKINTVDNSLNAKYNFSKKSGITLVARHYWSEVIIKQFYTLEQDGSLTENGLYNKNVNQNFNIFTVDMVYTWQFAAGSFLNVVWKNATGASDYPVSMGYFKNFSNTVGSTQNNNLSVKFLYYLDYLSFKKKR